MLVVGPGSGMCKYGFAGLRVDAPRAVLRLLPEAYRCVSVFSALLGSTADTCDALACEDFWKNFYFFHLSGGFGS